ncbi:hypothetical protein SARC_16548, partial [Sphaeroforma arctica JP610]
MSCVVFSSHCRTLQALTDKPFAPWMPVLDTRERFNSDNQMWAWIIGATSQEIIFVVCRN